MQLITLDHLIQNIMNRIGTHRNQINHRIAQEIICHSNSEYWDILLDLKSPDIYDKCESIARLDFPNVFIIESINPSCTAFIQRSPPNCLRRYDNQMISVYIGADMMALVHYFNEQQFTEDNIRKHKYYLSYIKYLKAKFALKSYI